MLWTLSSYHRYLPLLYLSSCTQVQAAAAGAAGGAAAGAGAAVAVAAAQSLLIQFCACSALTLLCSCSVMLLLLWCVSSEAIRGLSVLHPQGPRLHMPTWVTSLKQQSG